MENKSSWEKIKTTKRYLHPPFSGYFCTQWPDYKIILSKFETACATTLAYSAYPASGLRVLLGEELESVDFKQTRMVTREDGVPIHAMVNEQAGYTLEMENFCNTGTLRPSIFIRFKVKNEGSEQISSVIGLLVRSGPENYLTGTEADGYITYDGNVGNWGFAPSTWCWDGVSRLLDEKNSCAIEVEDNNGFDLRWHGKVKGYVWHQRDLLKAEFTLQPGEEKSLTLRMHFMDENEVTSDYETERCKAEAFWNKELKRIHHMPGKPEHTPMVLNFTSQLLQHFSSYLDEGFVAPRQGGMNRFFWSVESMYFLEALDQMGDFDDYNRTAYDFFLGKCQIKEGEEAGEVSLRTGWGSTTAGAVHACAYHVLNRDKAEFDRYKESLYLAFQWIQRQRAKSTELGCLYTGIFPAKRGTDWPGDFQSWCMTDAFSQQAVGILADAFEKFEDPRAEEIRREHAEYLACLKDILAQIVAQNTDPEELLIPNRLGIPQTDPPMGAYYADGPALLLGTGVMDPNSKEAKMAENYFRNRKCMQNGLTGLMSDGRLRPNKDTDAVAGHTWYLCSSDMRWFYVWLAQGEREKAEQVIDALLRYGVSTEYYVSERFADNEPYYVPWLPNASGNGRILTMLAEFYGTREV